MKVLCPSNISFACVCVEFLDIVNISPIETNGGFILCNIVSYDCVLVYEYISVVLKQNGNVQSYFISILVLKTYLLSFVEVILLILNNECRLMGWESHVLSDVRCKCWQVLHSSRVGALEDFYILLLLPLHPRKNRIRLWMIVCHLHYPYRVGPFVPQLDYRWWGKEEMNLLLLYQYWNALPINGALCK